MPGATAPPACSGEPLRTGTRTPPLLACLQRTLWRRLHLRMRAMRMMMRVQQCSTCCVQHHSPPCLSCENVGPGLSQAQPAVSAHAQRQARRPSQDAAVHRLANCGAVTSGLAACCPLMASHQPFGGCADVMLVRTCVAMQDFSCAYAWSWDTEYTAGSNQRPDVLSKTPQIQLN